MKSDFGLEEFIGYVRGVHDHQISKTIPPYQDNTLPDAKLNKARYITYRHSARVRNIAFQLDEEVFNRIVVLPCLYCGLQPANGIDRRDNNLGYTQTNSSPCCSPCNYMKKNMEEKEFVNHACKIFEHLQKEL
jgi:hypothetical protein